MIFLFCCFIFVLFNVSQCIVYASLVYISDQASGATRYYSDCKPYATSQGLPVYLSSKFIGKQEGPHFNSQHDFITISLYQVSDLCPDYNGNIPTLASIPFDPAVYINSSIAILLPSLYEGFGGTCSVETKYITIYNKFFKSNGVDGIILMVHSPGVGTPGVELNLHSMELDSSLVEDDKPSLLITQYEMLTCFDEINKYVQEGKVLLNIKLQIDKNPWYNVFLNSGWTVLNITNLIFFAIVVENAMRNLYAQYNKGCFTVTNSNGKRSSAKVNEYKRNNNKIILIVHSIILCEGLLMILYHGFGYQYSSSILPTNVAIGMEYSFSSLLILPVVLNSLHFQELSTSLRNVKYPSSILAKRRIILLFSGIILITIELLYLICSGFYIVFDSTPITLIFELFMIVFHGLIIYEVYRFRKYRLKHMNDPKDLIRQPHAGYVSSSPRSSTTRGPVIEQNESAVGAAKILSSRASSASLTRPHSKSDVVVETRHGHSKDAQQQQQQQQQQQRFHRHNSNLDKSRGMVRNHSSSANNINSVATSNNNNNNNGSQKPIAVRSIGKESLNTHSKQSSSYIVNMSFWLSISCGFAFIWCILFPFMVSQYSRIPSARLAMCFIYSIARDGIVLCQLFAVTPRYSINQPRSQGDSKQKESSRDGVEVTALHSASFHKSQQQQQHSSKKESVYGSMVDSSQAQSPGKGSFIFLNDAKKNSVGTPTNKAVTNPTSKDQDQYSLGTTLVEDIKRKAVSVPDTISEKAPYKKENVKKKSEVSKNQIPIQQVSQNLSTDSKKPVTENSEDLHEFSIDEDISKNAKE